MNILARDTANSLLGIVGLKLIRRYRAVEEYIPYKSTISGASAAHQSLGEYIDSKSGVPGATQRTIDELRSLGVFDKNIKRVCEIGSGSGRYLEKIMQACHPDYYEVYETAHEWRDWVVHQYGVMAQKTDGKSLAPTPSGSIDLVQAYKLFPGLPLFTTLGYLGEMARVVADSGTVVFDLLTEECLDDAMLEKWLASGISYPQSALSNQYIINFMFKRGLTLLGAFQIPMRPGVTQYLVFTR